MAQAFGLLLLMELGDKTQLAVLGLTARTGHTWPVFAGVSLGIAATTVLGVVAGAFIARFVPIAWVGYGAGALFVALGLLILWSSRKDEGGEGDSRIPDGPATPLRTLAVSFTIGLLAEMGDKSQVTVVGLTAKSDAPVEVFVGAVAAMTLLTLAAALVGRQVVHVLPERLVARGAGVLLIVVGALALAGVY